ncbi:hypothetical protein ACVWYG_000420 [Pedobacter sp. UYEF25]
MFKSIIEKVRLRFSSEELIFGSIAISTILIDHGSPVPALATCCLLAFYYFFFSWMMFSTKLEKHLWFSLISGVVYSLCLICMAFIIGVSYKGMSFFVLQIFLLASLGCFLYFQKSWGIYKGNHYIRISIIFFLNLFILFFK